MSCVCVRRRLRCLWARCLVYGFSLALGLYPVGPKSFGGALGAMAPAPPFASLDCVSLTSYCLSPENGSIFLFGVDSAICFLRACSANAAVVGYLVTKNNTRTQRSCYRICLRQCIAATKHHTGTSLQLLCYA